VIKGSEMKNKDSLGLQLTSEALDTLRDLQKVKHEEKGSYSMTKAVESTPRSSGGPLRGLVRSLAWMISGFTTSGIPSQAT
jgi:hypothetical protein